jgi:hypothetical protein
MELATSAKALSIIKSENFITMLDYCPLLKESIYLQENAGPHHWGVSIEVTVFLDTFNILEVCLPPDTQTLCKAN